VPSIARTKHVTRQHFQAIVNGLVEALGSLDLAPARTSRAGRSKRQGRHARVDRKPEE